MEIPHLMWTTNGAHPDANGVIYTSLLRATPQETNSNGHQ